MFVRNALGRIVDIPETLEKSVAFRNDLEVLSVSQTFWRTYPDLVERLKKTYPSLVTDEELHKAFPVLENIHRGYSVVPKDDLISFIETASSQEPC